MDLILTSVNLLQKGSVIGCLFLDCVFWVLIFYSGINPDLILYYRYLDNDANHDIVVGSLVYSIRSVIILQPFTHLFRLHGYIFSLF